MGKKVQPLRLSWGDQFAALYAELCDVIYRDDMDVHPSNPHHHTSAHARKVADAIIERLEATHFLTIV